MLDGNFFLSYFVFHVDEYKFDLIQEQYSQHLKLECSLSIFIGTTIAFT